MTANASKTVTDAILALVGPIVSDLKLDLYDLEFNGGILKITIDTPPGVVNENGRGGVNLDQLALVTRLVGRDLDHHDPIPGHYTLEVSSPGLERTLRTPAHFQRELGKDINVRLKTQLDGARRFVGVLVAADDTTATVRLDDLSERVIPIDLIDRARTVFQWEKGEKLTPSTAKPKAKTGAATTKRQAPANSPKRARNTLVPAGGVKPRGPSDEVDPTIEEEATA